MVFGSDSLTINSGEDVDSLKDSLEDGVGYVNVEDSSIELNRNGVFGSFRVKKKKTITKTDDMDDSTVLYEEARAEEIKENKEQMVTSTPRCRDSNKWIV